MAPAARTVRRLRLRAPSEAAVRRTARALEDALRTAALPDGGGRILLVRRLALGRLAPDAAPVSVALALEEAVARIATEWRHGDDAGAAAAGAVWFRDPLEAHLALARRLLAGQRPAAWYWPLAVPAWHPGMVLGEGVRAIVHSLAGRPEAPTALPCWFAGLVDGGYGGALAAVLGEADVVPLARAAGVKVEVEEGSGSDGLRALPGARDDEVSWRRGAGGVRGLIAAMMQATAGGAGGGRRVSPFRSTSGRGEASPVPRGSAFAPVAVGGSPRVEGAGAPGGPSARPRAAAGPDHADGASRTPDAHGFSGERGTSKAEGEPEGGVSGSTSPASNGLSSCRSQTPTAAGGLLFLVAALERLGYAEWIARQPEWQPAEVARCVLLRAMRRLRLPAGDPMWAALRLPAATAATPHRFVAPLRWRDGLLAGPGPLLRAAARREGRLRDPSGRLLLAGWRGPCPRALLRDRRGAVPASRPPGDLADEVVEAWEIATRRWLRRFARLGVADLVLRPAALAATPTHIDVHFDLSAADARIRRAGLDLDPGWIPWLGRVVAFHYERGGAP